jgi:cell division initiation protein
MITAMEIRNQQFGKSLRGYNEEEVKNFLMQLAQDYENLYSQNATLKESIQRLEAELLKYHKIEDTMNNSLIFAQQTAEDMKTNARREAELILVDAKKRIAELLMVYQEVIKRLNLFNTELKAQMSGQMELLEKNQQRIEECTQFFYSKDLKDIVEKLEQVNIKDV